MFRAMLHQATVCLQQLVHPVMMSRLVLSVILGITLLVPALALNVSYDSRALTLDGQRRLLIAGCIHYPRSTPAMWPSLISKAKAGGIDVVQTYLFWNLHEPVKGQFDFTGRKNIFAFFEEVQRQGLYVNFVCFFILSDVLNVFFL
jgi:hypothetical protein